VSARTNHPAEPRDFRRPRRFGRARLRELSNALTNALPGLERKLAEGFSLRAGLALARLGEVDAETLFAAAAEPLCVLRFRAPQPAWLSIEPADAVALVEAILGAKSAAGPAAARKFSPSEVRIAGALLGELARGVTAAWQLQATDPALVQAPAELGSWREGGAGAESHRLEVELVLERAGARSTLRLYLPGIAAEPLAPKAALPARLPAHLERVEIELSARLGGCALSLDQIVGLEEGDVIPLTARVGDPAALCVEGLSLARARVGSHRGRLAVRIEQISVQDEEAA
jgi:flagellar motor switch protein FliM